jgi:hypothetical protein
MREITANKFQELVKADPAWATKLSRKQEIVRVTGFVSLDNPAGITHLSRYLEFWVAWKSTASMTWAADFSHCEELKVAEGTFHEFVDFSSSGIEEIGDLWLPRAEPWPMNDDKKRAKKILCDLTGTPLAQKKPRLAAATMCGTDAEANDTNIARWEEILKNIPTGPQWEKTKGLIKWVIGQAHKEQMVSNLGSHSSKDLNI